VTVSDETGGLEYAIIRRSDNAYLFDSEGDGTDAAWESDEENASWYDTEELALAVADVNGLTVDADTPTLADGYAIATRAWSFEDDLEPDDVDRMADMLEDA